MLAPPTGAGHQRGGQPFWRVLGVRCCQERDIVLSMPIRDLVQKEGRGDRKPISGGACVPWAGAAAGGREGTRVPANGLGLASLPGACARRARWLRPLPAASACGRASRDETGLPGHGVPKPALRC